MQNVDALRSYVEASTISFTPARADDDDFMLAYARDRPSVQIVTNDHFEDHVRSGRITDEWRRTHLVKY